MSVIFQGDEGLVVCHEKYLKNLYTKVVKGEDAIELTPHQFLFLIKTPYMKHEEAQKKVKDMSVSVKPHSARKRKRNSDLTFSVNSKLLEISAIKDAYEKLLKNVQSLGYFTCVPSVDDILHNNKNARELSETLYRDSANWVSAPFNGENNTDFTLMRKIGSQFFVFPEHCKFYCQDVHEIRNCLDSLKKFDLILLDPPWWNKYIRRKKSKSLEQGYKMMYNKSLGELPLNELLAPGGIIAVWCTNASSNLKELREELFPIWGTQQVAHWVWLKVTQAGELVCPFSDPPGKQPFEQLIFAVRPDEMAMLPRPDDGKIFMSVPSAIHSHKPPILEMLKENLPPQPRCLEIFARYLLPNWTSWGLEVLKLQHHSLFQEAQTTKD